MDTNTVCVWNKIIPINICMCTTSAVKVVYATKSEKSRASLILINCDRGGKNGEKTIEKKNAEKG